MTRLILVRHGQTEWNAEGRMQGQGDVPLSDVGRAQAAELAPCVAALRPAVVVSSPLVRARVTAETIASACGLEVDYDPRLAEINIGSWSGRLWREVAAESPDLADAVAAGRDFRRSETGETAAEAGERCASGLLAVADRLGAGTGLVVGHGLAMRMAIVRLLGWDAATAASLTGLWNCSWTILERRDRWRLESYNNVAG